MLYCIQGLEASLLLTIFLGSAFYGISSLLCQLFSFTRCLQMELQSLFFIMVQNSKTWKRKVRAHKRAMSLHRVSLSAYLIVLILPYIIVIGCAFSVSACHYIPTTPRKEILAQGQS